MKKVVVQFKDFNFLYKNQKYPTLKNINLTIYEGEKVLIVGPSGSGKSTLSHCINGLAPFFYEGAYTGTLSICGNPISSIAQAANSVGTVLQDPDGQFVGLTVGEDIAFKLENDAIAQSEMKALVANAAKMVDIESNLLASPHQLSGGQKQRVTLAGTLIRDLPILLFDEPLANLDPATGKSAIELINKVGHDKTVIIIEHRLEDVLHCHLDRIVVIYDGQIVADHAPNNILITDTLIQAGIREPLYIAALKYADIELTIRSNLSNINSLHIPGMAQKLQEWQDQIPAAPKPALTNPILEFKNVSFSYSASSKVLNNINFTIYQGEMLSIVGKNGAGKSTIAKLICGFFKPTRGKILFNDHDIFPFSIAERANHIGVVLQNPNQMISQTMLFDEVAFGLKIQNIPATKIVERVYATLKICGLYHFRNWPISALSFGQKKRVTIASILVMNPDIIILDEPTAGQDFKNYTRIMEFLRELNQKGITIIIITHDMHLMLEYTDRAIVLADGNKLAEAATVDVLTDTNLIEAAHLKVTSLYTLAIYAGLAQPKEFVKRFISHDRRVRFENTGIY